MAFKPLKELTLMDDFLFGEVMQDNEAARLMLEIILDKPIEYVRQNEIQKVINTEPDFHSVRLDAYLRDENHTVYNIEVQVVNNRNLAKRSRYYQSLMDYQLMKKGDASYKELPASYVIFICAFDAYSQGRFQYSFENRCLQDLTLSLGDASIKMFLNTRGTDSDGISPRLVRFLHYVESGSDELAQADEDRALAYLQQQIRIIKTDSKKEARYMLLMEKMKEERAEGWAEGLAKGLIEGEARGEAKGEAKGRREGLYITARNMLVEGIEVKLIAKVTGLTEEEIESLRSEN